MSDVVDDAARIHWIADKARRPWGELSDFALRYNPTPTPRINADGTKSLGLIFPALVLTSFVADPDKIAPALARELNAHEPMLAALKALLKHYVQLVECGDCGHWNPHEEPVVAAATAAIALAEGGAS